jgi:hypothetical protein
MSSRNEYLSQYFNEWLDRFSPPRAIQNNPKAMQDDANSMLAIVGKYAPSQGYAEWLDKVLTDLTESMTTRSWPAPGELVKACKSRTEHREKPKGEEWQIDEAAVIGAKMKAGDPVGEGWLYGRSAVDLIKRGLVDLETMTAYRSAAFFARKGKNNEAAALAWEAEAKARHEAAKEMLRDTERHQRNVRIPSKRSVPEAAE